jgi:hypothetical protein
MVTGEEDFWHARIHVWLPLAAAAAYLWRCRGFDAERLVIEGGDDGDVGFCNFATRRSCEHTMRPHSIIYAAHAAPDSDDCHSRPAERFCPAWPSREATRHRVSDASLPRPMPSPFYRAIIMRLKYFIHLYGYIYRRKFHYSARPYDNRAATQQSLNFSELFSGF